MRVKDVYRTYESQYLVEMGCPILVNGQDMRITIGPHWTGIMELSILSRMSILFVCGKCSESFVT